jgi:hypothetical protein
VNPKRSTRTRTWFGDSCVGFGCETNTEGASGWGKLDNLGTASVRLWPSMVNPATPNHKSFDGNQSTLVNSPRVWYYFLYARTMGIADRVDIYMMVYITRFRCKQERTTVNSYRYLEAIDTVNNKQNKESNNTAMWSIHFV